VSTGRVAAGAARKAARKVERLRKSAKKALAASAGEMSKPSKQTQVVDKEAEENAKRNKECIVTEGRSQPFCSLCKTDIVHTPKAIKSHLKSKPHKIALKKSQPAKKETNKGKSDSESDADEELQTRKASKKENKPKKKKDHSESDSDSELKKKKKKKDKSESDSDSDSEKKKKKKKRDIKREASSDEEDETSTKKSMRKKLRQTSSHEEEESEKKKSSKKKRRQVSSESDSEDEAPKTKKKKGIDSQAEAKILEKKSSSVPIPTGCIAVLVSNIPASASQKSQGALRKLFPKATKVVYGAPGKARVCFLDSVDIPDAVAVDGTLLHGSSLCVSPESPEAVAAEADKAAAGHEVFLKWLPPIANEKGLAEMFEDCGELLGDVRLKRNPQDGSCMGIGWVTFATAEAAKLAVQKSGARYPRAPPGRGINVTPATVTLATTAARERGSLQAAGTHTPAMCEETLRVLVIPDPNGVYVDGTFGRGGHTRAILSRLSQAGRLHAFDLDPDAIQVGKELEREDPRFKIHHKPFGHMATVLEAEGLLGKVSGVFLDLGISSPQFDSTNRGFRPEMDGPLDLRFDLTRGSSAYELLKSVDRLELRKILIENGEADEVAARRIADAVAVHVQQGTLPERTREFADMVVRAKGKEYQVGCEKTPI